MSVPHPTFATQHGVFVTGTDTGVGKTLVACALLHALAARGKRVVGMKPVAAGAQAGPHGTRNEDVERLLAAGNVEVPQARVSPYCFAPAIAPHLAARAAGVEIDLNAIATAYRELASLADFVVVEGAGGFRVPLNAREDMADLARLLGLPVVLVVGMRLGCLNHALLSAAAIRSSSLRLAGWCANHVDPAMECADGNVSALAERLEAPLLGRIRYTPAPDPRAVAAVLDPGSLMIVTH